MCRRRGRKGRRECRPKSSFANWWCLENYWLGKVAKVKRNILPTFSSKKKKKKKQDHPFEVQQKFNNYNNYSYIQYAVSTFCVEIVSCFLCLFFFFFIYFLCSSDTWLFPMLFAGDTGNNGNVCSGLIKGHWSFLNRRWSQANKGSLLRWGLEVIKGLSDQENSYMLGSGDIKVKRKEGLYPIGESCSTKS